MTKIALIPFLLLPLAAADAEGCKDPRHLPRLRGCVIDACERKAFDVGKILTGLREGEEVIKEVEGEKDYVEYVCPSEVSMVEMARNVSNALKQAGIMPLYQGKDYFSAPAVSARKGNVWMTVRTASDPRYSVLTVIQKEMEQQLSVSWAADIEKTGRAAVYGIEFATASARIQPASEETLRQVLELLKAQAAWNFRIEGHTDSTGAAAVNQKLSAARAAAVRDWLVANGIAAARLTTQGFGPAKPVASNDTEEGKAKNRRVELVKTN